jgi:trans-feruloyl-CoA hydratase/vanillin synthase
MVNGWCFGGAFSIVAGCDIAIAADEAMFGLSEVNFGHFPGGPVSKQISAIMRPREAVYYILTGDQFDGKRAGGDRLDYLLGARGAVEGRSGKAREKVV